MSHVTQAQWAVALLRRLNIPRSQGALRAVVGWENAEGGHWKNSARYNPLNTTMPAAGAGNTGSQGNIKVYRNWDQGLNATVRTLENGRYGNILSALRRGNAGAVGRAISSSPWGTGGLAAQVISKTPRISGAGGGLAGGGGSSTTTQTTVQLPQLAQVDIASLLSQAQQPQPIQASIPPQPSFAAHAPAAPAGYTPPPQVSVPAPKPSMDELLKVATEAQTGSAGAATTTTTDVSGGAAGTGGKVQAIFERAVQINGAHLPYKWGGGHGGKVNAAKPVPLDCSGAVSAVLGINPRVSGQFEGWGQAGKGKHVTIYANSHHVLMEINGHFFGTSHANQGGGAGWIPRKFISSAYLKDFTVRHPVGL